VSDSSNDIPKRNAPEMTDAELAAAARMISVDARKVVLLGTVLFFATFVVLLPFWSWLGRHDHRVWLWTCLAGGVLGLLGYTLMGKHRRAGRTI
jgi:hypothetical protein